MNDDRESGEYPVFDGSAPEGAVDEASMNLHELYFDTEGRSTTPEAHMRAFPVGRLIVARDGAFGLSVSTEFSGINHNPDPNGAPLICETLVQIDGDIVYSKWTGSVAEGRRAHTAAIWRVWFGGAVVWRVGHTLRLWRFRMNRAAELSDLRRRQRERESEGGLS